MLEEEMPEWTRRTLAKGEAIVLKRQIQRKLGSLSRMRFALELKQRSPTNSSTGLTDSSWRRR